MMTDMQPGDIGLEISDDDIPYWAEGIPHCEACGRFCLYLEPGEGIFLANDWDDPIEGMPPITDRDRLLVCSVPGVPISVARCPDCIEAEVWPYDVLVSQASLITNPETPGSWTDQWSEVFIHLCETTLHYLGKDWQTFLHDVRDDIRAMEEYMADTSLDGPEREVVVGEPYVLDAPGDTFRSFRETLGDGPVLFSLNGGPFEEGTLSSGDPDTITREEAGEAMKDAIGPGRVLYGDPVETLPDGSIASAGCPVCDDAHATTQVLRINGERVTKEEWDRYHLGCPVCTLKTKDYTWLCERADCPYLSSGEESRS